MSVPAVRLGVVAVLLVAATLVSAAIGHGHHDGAARTGTVVVLLIAFVKARVIAAEFMELRRAPRLLAALMDAWIAATCTALVVCFAV